MVQVVQFRLDGSDAVVSELGQHLNEAERARAARFKREVHQRRFTVGRGRLRVLLGYFTGLAPHALTFSYGPHGKPSLAAHAGGVTFNLSHSEEEALCTVALEQELGVDLEHRSPRVRMEAIARRFFRPEEAALLDGLEEGAKIAMFYQLWTAKEALLKGVGGGLTLPLNQCAFSPGTAPLGLKLHGLPDVARDLWQVYTLPVPGEFGAALAVSGPIQRIQCGQWDG